MLVLASLLVASLFAQDPVRVGATLSASRVEVGSPTTLRITIETRGEAPDAILLPQLPRDLDIVSTSDFSQTMISVPGGRSRATRREVVIVARRPGVFRIPPVTVEVGGRSHRTRSLDLVVSAGPATRAPSPGPGYDEGDDATPARSSIRMWLRPDTVFVGQQVLLHAEATFGEDARGRQTRPATFDPPAPAGFWIQDVPNPVSVSLRVREGRTIETQTFRRAYFPLDAGSYTIPPAQLYYEARRGFLMAAETRRIVSDSARLVVLPLPARGRPAGFSGAVGRLSIRASLSPERVAVGEAALLTVEVVGTGNVKALPEPRLGDLADVEVFAPTQESNVEVENLNVGGTKRFTWMLVPQQPGTVTVPAVEYSVFDPELRQYVVLRSDTLRLEAFALSGSTAVDTTVRPLRTGTGGEPAGWARSGAFAALQVTPLLILALAAVVRRRREAPPGPRQHYRRIRAELAALRTQPATHGLAALERVVIEAAVCVAGADRDDPVTSLRAHGRPAQAYALGGILRAISRLRFSPQPDAGAADDVFARADAFLAMIAPPRFGGKRNVTSALLVTAALSFSPPPSLAASPDSFGNAVAAYEAGDFVAAAGGFHAYARAHPRDPNGWYNLGLAAHAAGDPGRAVWAWLRAARVAPRDADLAHNLRMVGASESVRHVRPPDFMAPAERIAVAAGAWWLLVLAFGMRRWKRRFAVWAGSVAAVALVLTVAAAAFEAARPRTVTPLGTGTILRAGPSIHDEAAGSLAVGELARLVEDRDGWLRVRLAHGRDAWVERAAVASP
jgi:hypothetical protein